MLAHRNSFQLRRITVIAPAVRNDGEVSYYGRRMAYALTARGYNFTEYQTVGVWLGDREEGTLFELYVGSDDPAQVDDIGRLARAVMMDQDAIQVTVDPYPTTLLEY